MALDVAVIDGLAQRRTAGSANQRANRLFATPRQLMTKQRAHRCTDQQTRGAVVTAALFSLGKFAIGLYLGNSAVASGFGAAGSVIALLLWVYYSAQIFFLGAEFTRQYALRFGSLQHER